MVVYWSIQAWGKIEAICLPNDIAEVYFINKFPEVFFHENSPNVRSQSMKARKKSAHEPLIISLDCIMIHQNQFRNLNKKIKCFQLLWRK